MWKGTILFPFMSSSNRPYDWLHFCCQDRGMGARFTLHVCATDYMIKAEQLHWATEGARWLAVLPFFQLCKMILTAGSAGSGFRTASVRDKFMRAGLNACCASGFPPHSAGCWNIYGEKSLMSWKKEIMSYKTADYHKDSSSFGWLEFLPLTCRDRLGPSLMEMSAVQDFTCLMKWEDVPLSQLLLMRFILSLLSFAVQKGGILW